MKAKPRKGARQTQTTGRAAAEARTARRPWARRGYWLAGAAAVILALWAYAPALHGAFLFDDNALPFALPEFHKPYMSWVLSSSMRPVLFTTYWLNSWFSGDDPFSYHVLNVVVHVVASGLMFVVVRRLLDSQRGDKSAAPARSESNLLAALAAAIFLLHPVQTEAVAYLAGRSDSLSVMFFLAAFAVFLYRPAAAIGWGRVAAVLALFVAALGSKQDAITLPVLLLLTDYWWNPGGSVEGIRMNWRLYVPMAFGAAAGLAMSWYLIRGASTAGFSFKGFTWYQYFFTECRALFVYIGQFLLPVHLDADWDFSISRTIWQGGAIFAMAALAGLVVLAWHYRRRFPLATYGFLVYLLLMAPTSSVLPIADPVADRRLYLSMIGLLLVLVDGVARLHWQQKRLAVASAAVVALLACATRVHAAVWASPVALWQDTAQKSPQKRRVHFQLANAYYDEGRCDLALPEYQKTAQLAPPDHNLLVDWALDYDCLNQPDMAVAKLRQAALLERTAHVYSQIGMVYAKRSRWAEAMEALDEAQKIDPTYSMTYYYKGGVYLSQNMVPQAVENYRLAVQLDPEYEPAVQGLANAEARLRALQSARR